MNHTEDTSEEHQTEEGESFCGSDDNFATAAWEMTGDAQWKNE